MRFLFATGEAFLPELVGGAECSIDELARELSGRGHTCRVVAGSARRWWRARSIAWKLLGERAPMGSHRGIPVRRVTPTLTPAAVVAEIRRARPDVVMTWNGVCAEIAHATLAAGVPVIVWVPDADFARYSAALPRGPGVRLAACSAFVAERLRTRLAVDADVLRPVIRLDEYRAASRRPDAITLITPRDDKGLEVVLGVAARLRHRRFLLAGSSMLRARDRLRLRVRLARHPNVAWIPSVPWLRDVYARTALLLVPSQVEDASPRVILEAQVNGIPVVGSRTGGIPEVMGDGGVLVARLAPAAAWADAVESILADPARAATLSAQARANAARPEFGAGFIVDHFLALAHAHATALGSRAA